MLSPVFHYISLKNFFAREHFLVEVKHIADHMMDSDEVSSW